MPLWFQVHRYLRDGVLMISQKELRQPFFAKGLASNERCLVQIPSAIKKRNEIFIRVSFNPTWTITNVICDFFLHFLLGKRMSMYYKKEMSPKLTTLEYSWQIKGKQSLIKLYTSPLLKQSNQSPKHSIITSPVN